MQPKIKLFLLLFVFSFTFLFPLINVLLLLRFKVISSLHMPTKEERRIPLLVTSCFYVTAYYLLRYSGISETLKILMLGASLSVILSTIINFFWKISLHLMAFGSLVGIIYTISYNLFISAHYLMTFFVLLSALVAYSRLQLSAHNPRQVYGGFLIGFLIQLILLL